MKLNVDMVGLAVAAQQLRLPYQDAHRLLLVGRLRGEKRRGRWFVRVEDVQQVAREQQSEAASDAAPA